jgi:magnesium transporter
MSDEENKRSEEGLATVTPLNIERASERPTEAAESAAPIVSESTPESDKTEGQPPLFNLFESWSALSVGERRARFAELPRTEAEELFLSLKTHDQAELISEASALEKRSWVRLLAPDDVADLIQELGPDHRDEILQLLDHQTKREVTALLAYAEDNAGGLMNSRFVRLRPDMSVDEAISYLRIQAKTQVETIYYAYVIDSDQTLMGVVSFRELFSAAPHKKIREIMKTEMIQVPVNMEQEQIAKVFSQHEFTAIPVVDEWGHMKGIVTFDDIASVIQEEATEDIQKLGAVEALDAPYMKIGFVELVRKRAGWLLILFVSEMFTATAMGYFQTEIEKAVVLALFIPLIISSGGNSGSQASTLIIRAMALGEVRLRDWWRVFLRELGVGLALGLILAAVGFCRIMIWPGRETLYGPHYQLVAATVAGSIIGVVLWGSISGSMLPFLLRLFRFDPASASAPFVATLCDVTGLIIYFTVASLLLSGIML